MGIVENRDKSQMLPLITDQSETTYLWSNQVRKKGSNGRDGGASVPWKRVHLFACGGRGWWRAVSFFPGIATCARAHPHPHTHTHPLAWSEAWELARDLSLPTNKVTNKVKLNQGNGDTPPFDFQIIKGLGECSVLPIASPVPGSLEGHLATCIKAFKLWIFDPAVPLLRINLQP